MKNLVTIVFNAYYSDEALKKILKKLKNFKIIVIDNSLQINTKKKFENKYKNVRVILPKKNLGLSKGYNLGIKESKTKYVFLNNPDIDIAPKQIISLLKYAKKIKKFGILSPVYDDENCFKNYRNENNVKIQNDYIEAKWIDNNFLLDKTKIKNNLFDENYFLYFETLDFCLKLKRMGKKLFVIKKIKFKHFHSSSVNKKYSKLILLTRSWHYNWSKFYYYKKNYNYFYAINKIIPNLYQSLRNLIFHSLQLKFFQAQLNIVEIYGLLSSLIGTRSFYRAKN